MDAGVEKHRNSMEGIPHELYEEEYRRNMKGIVNALAELGEIGLAYRVKRKLEKYDRERAELRMRTLKPDNDHWLPMWANYLKRIPKQGLNNMTQKARYGPERRSVPTLPRRLKSICISQSWFGGHRLPFFYFHMDARAGHETENIPKVQELTEQIIERLEELYKNMDTVTVLKESTLQYWKEQVWYTILWIKKQSGWVGLELIQEAGYEMLESTPLAPLIEKMKEEPK